MQMSNNTILITGGTSGIGYALAAQFLERGNTVLITGRTEERLASVRQSLPGVHTYVSDVSDPAAIRRLYSEVTRAFPDLNVLINNAGIGLKRNLNDTTGQLEDLDTEIKTNLIGPIQMIKQFLPQLRRQRTAAIVNVSSGLAFVPLAVKPIYCATKAAIHSYTQSLRYQLRGTSVQVIELPPPYVATDLMDGRTDPRAMPLDAFIAEVMEILTNHPNATEICVERVKGLRFAEASGKYDGIFQGLNDAMH